MTNLEKIRCMDEDELARLARRYIPCLDCPMKCECMEGGITNCADAWMMWFKEESKR